MMKIKKLSRKRIVGALPLVWDVFSAYEAANYPENGKRAFWDAIHSEAYLDTLTAYGAYENEELAGIIATKNGGTHLALFFVDGKYHGQGIGKSLWHAILAENTSPTISVHSSLYAVDIYKRLGFSITGEMKNDGGIQYVPMEYRMIINPDCPCTRAKCVRHGKCNECRVHHEKRNQQDMIQCHRRTDRRND